MISCSQHDAESVIVDQRTPCEGKVVVIEWVINGSEGVTTVCEAHMPSFEARGLESHGYTLSRPREIGAIGEKSLSSPDLECEH